jgi:hypothetical protein
MGEMFENYSSNTGLTSRIYDKIENLPNKNQIFYLKVDK